MQYDRSLIEVQEALRVDPDNERAQSYLGDALVMLGRLPEALTAYEQAARLAPGKALNHYKLAGAYRSARRPEDARASYLKALELEPDHAFAAVDLGQLELGLGHVDEAEAIHARLLTINTAAAERLRRDIDAALRQSR
jgi:tetratricopeptide (TPR) repeat protein